MIYFDHNATTPCHEDVVQAMLPYFTQKYGNASSGMYPLSWQSQYAVEEARSHVADLISAESDEIIFTSGSTESCYLGIRGLIELYHTARKDYVPHVISSPMEHSAVIEVLKDLENMGWCTVSWVRNDVHGKVHVEDIKAAKTENTVLIALMLANNVTGVVQDMRTICEWARAEKISTFCDTTQAIGKIAVSVKELGIDMCTLSAHKIYGPKGIGCLYLRKGRPSIRIKSLLSGGGQEHKMRGGTQNVPGIVGFGKACELAIQKLDELQKVQELRDFFEEKMSAHFDSYIWGGELCRTPNVSMVGVRNLRSIDIMNALKGQYAFSLGSACQAHENKPSYVLKSMQPDSEYISGSFRVSFGVQNTEDEILKFINDLKRL